jgi:hypothetical protein
MIVRKKATKDQGEKLMRRQITQMSVSALASGLLLFPTTFGQEKPKSDDYAAVWAITGGGAGGGSSVPINIHVNRYNTDQEMKSYAELLATKGPDGLRGVLEDEDVGQLSPLGRVGTPLAIARRLVRGDKTIVRVLSVRNQSFAELRSSGRSVDYPYTILELVLDKSGKGTGTAIGAAKIRFNKKKNIYEIESFQQGAAYNKLLNVRRMN